LSQKKENEKKEKNKDRKKQFPNLNLIRTLKSQENGGEFIVKVFSKLIPASQESLRILSRESEKKSSLDLLY
jgi:hypothetical protein